MGCVSSKLFSKDFNQEEETVVGNGDYSNHIVSLTSSTYGVLSLDQESVKETVKETMISPPHHVVSPKLQRKVIEDPEIINTWKLMEDLEDEIPISVQTKKSPTSRVAGADARNPSKFFDEINSPKKQKKYSGKENKNRQSGYDGSVGGTEHNPKQVLKPISSLENVQKATPTLKTPTKVTPVDLNSSSFRFHPVISNPRKSLSPLFDPELLASFERELNEEGEQIKKMVFPEPRIQKTLDSESMLEAFEKKCPPGGENAVVIYTTTLRGIRKTFEDCNNVRSVIECHNVHMIERDISMDSGFREELRRLMGKKEVRVPVVFVKGRLIGGADELVKMEEEGKLGMFFRGIPRALAGCEGCGGLRFVMCVDCSGSCKVLDQDSNKMVKCGECNENGLIQCPICC